ncbi:MAG: methylated-DNA--[protein]-cysteine S-methyltransferase [Actinomycetota bacterium]|nr:methylated-DNA--[protein]-cysteine S-methyltransferase [Actinomycetota bacterium]
MTTVLDVGPRDRVAAACHAMNAAGGPVPVAALAASGHCSVRQLQRDFAEVLGVSPRQYGQAVRTDRARVLLRSSPTVLDAAFDAGYGSVRAFYEEAARRLGMPPSAYVAGAPSQLLLWSVTPSAVGDVIAVATPRGLAAVRIGSAADLEQQVRAEFPKAILERDDAAMADVMDALRQLCMGRPAPDLPLDVHGTAFQARVWQALREIPSGQTRSYAEVAEAIGSPHAVRAVASACASNRVAVAIPCHRVIRGDGSLAGYRWGLAVKESLLANERA